MDFVLFFIKTLFEMFYWTHQQFITEIVELNLTWFWSNSILSLFTIISFDHHWWRASAFIFALSIKESIQHKTHQFPSRNFFLKSWFLWNGESFFVLQFFCSLQREMCADASKPHQYIDKDTIGQRIVGKLAFYPPHPSTCISKLAWRSRLMTVSVSEMGLWRSPRPLSILDQISEEVEKVKVIIDVKENHIEYEDGKDFDVHYIPVESETIVLFHIKHENPKYAFLLAFRCVFLEEQWFFAMEMQLIVELSCHDVFLWVFSLDLMCLLSIMMATDSVQVWTRSREV